MDNPSTGPAKMKSVSLAAAYYQHVAACETLRVSGEKDWGSTDSPNSSARALECGIYLLLPSKAGRPRSLRTAESIMLMRQVDKYIKTAPTALTMSERKDLRFHVATVATALHLNRPKLDPRKVTPGMLERVADATMSEAFDIVLELVEEQRKGLEGEAADLDRIAKSPKLQQAIQAKLKEELRRKNDAVQIEDA